MADGKPEGVSDDEWAAILDHRKATRPVRKGFFRGTDPDSGTEFEIELTPDEAEKLIGRHAKLFADDDKSGGGAGGDGKDDKKPAQLKDYFGKRKAAGS
jgi:hypothetical protein